MASVELKDLPISMSAVMIRALQAGAKTQTRRPVKPQPRKADVDKCKALYVEHDGRLSGITKVRTQVSFELLPDDGQRSIICPYEIGQRLWVREPLFRGVQITIGRGSGTVSPQIVQYAADNTPVPAGKHAASSWRGCAVWNWKVKSLSSRYMPRWACRLFLEVVDRRAERLQDISEEDARAEGAREAISSRDGKGYDNDMEQWCRWSRRLDPNAGAGTGRGAFAAIWDRIYGFGSWHRNDVVWAYTFKQVDGR